MREEKLRLQGGRECYERNIVAPRANCYLLSWVTWSGARRASHFAVLCSALGYTGANTTGSRVQEASRMSARQMETMNCLFWLVLPIVVLVCYYWLESEHLLVLQSPLRGGIFLSCLGISGVKAGECLLKIVASFKKGLHCFANQLWIENRYVQTHLSRKILPLTN